MMGGCASDAPYEPATYVVRPQDSLYSIAWRHNLDYRTLAKWNNIGADYRVSAGQVLVLQPSGVPREPSGEPRAPPAAAAPSGSQRAGDAGQTHGPEPVAAPASNGNSKW